MNSAHAWFVRPLAFALLIALIGNQVVAQELPAPTEKPTLEGVSKKITELEEVNRRLKEQLKVLTGTDIDETSSSGELPTPVGTISPKLDSPVPDYSEGMFAPFSAPQFPTPNVGKVDDSAIRVRFGPGFQFLSKDNDFTLRINYESQIEGRVWGQGDQIPANGGIFLPRQRFFFSGNITKPVEYEIAINRGLGGINVLNAFLNFHFDDRFEVRVGRFFTPFTYDQFAVSNYWLITPERSIFTTNLSPNRQFGVMAWGYLFEKQLDYAVGAFNGSRNSFENLNNNMDFVSYLNVRPFQYSDHIPLLQFLNIGTSVAYGHQDQNPAPASFRIAGGSPDTNIPGNATVPFLILNPGVREQGDRLLGSVHSALFYKGLSLQGEWQYGYGNYSNPANRLRSAEVPFSGFYVSVAYLLTGEHVERRARLRPLRPVFPVNKGEQRGIGAWELAFRVSQLNLGQEVFDAGLANDTLWSNSALTAELGTNWYLNEYLKISTFWLHGEFGDPVQYRPGEFQKTADMFWLRCQLYF